ncbi:hypothetical protein D3C76_1447950 [compost metagenome]
MADRAGGKAAVEPGDRALVVLVVGRIEKTAARGTVLIADVKRGIYAVLAGVLGASAGV